MVETLTFKKLYIETFETDTNDKALETKVTGEHRMVTFPYPYMNGPLHLGHLFSMSKAEMTARWWQLNGHQVLFPFGFHCTGMPIAASALKIERGDEAQIKQLTEQGMSRDQALEFARPEKWLDYYPTKAIKDLQECYRPMVDWSRSFITTSKNPYYDGFVNWHFHQLYKKGLLVRATRPTIYDPSIVPDQPCQDHDRKSGEGVGVVQVKLMAIQLADKTFLYFLESRGDSEHVAAASALYTKKDVEWVKFKNGSISKDLFQMISKQLTEESTSSTNELTCSIPIVQEKRQPKGTSWFEQLSGCRIESASEADGECVEVNDTGIHVWVTEQEVIARTGVHCSVVEMNQWYIDYGNQDWKKQLLNFMTSADFKVENEVVKNELMIAAERLGPWACARSLGLGTKFPFKEGGMGDEEGDLVIDSLSDSTIYMAYYTVAGLLHPATLDGSEKKPLVTPEIATKIEFWDAVFLGKIDYFHPAVAQLRAEFLKWYPLNLRVSGKDLIYNHLIMCLYNHLAVFGEDLTPREFYCNGHITVNKTKMSKSLGNFITLRQAVEDHGLSVTRLMIAEAGDSSSDANLNLRVTDAHTKTLYSLVKWYELNSSGYLEMSRKINAKWADVLKTITIDIDVAAKVFITKLKTHYEQCVQAYNQLHFKKASQLALFQLNLDKDEYLKLVKHLGVEKNPTLIYLHMNLQSWLLYPILPQLSNGIRSSFMGGSGMGCWVVNDLRSYPELVEDIEQLTAITKKLTTMMQKNRKKKRAVSRYVALIAPDRLERITPLVNMIHRINGLDNASFMLEVSDQIKGDIVKYRVE